MLWLNYFLNTRTSRSVLSFSSVRLAVRPFATKNLRSDSLVFFMKLESPKVRKMTEYDFEKKVATGQEGPKCPEKMRFCEV